MADERVRIGIVVGFREERAAVDGALSGLGDGARAGVRVLQGGVGGAMAAAGARELLSRAPRIRVLVSCGFSGGLVDALSVGDVLLVSAVTARRNLEIEARSEESLACAKHLRERAAAAFSSAAFAFHEGPLVTLAQPVLRAEEKRVLGERAGAHAVDMEAAAVARVARESGIEFVALRTISDAVDDALPPEVAAFLDERGRVRTRKVLSFAARGPGHLKELWQLKSRSDRAAAALKAAVRIAVPAWLEALDSGAG